MEEKLRGMRVNQNQRKQIMAAARFGIGPLASVGGQTEDDRRHEPLLPLPGEAGSRSNAGIAGRRPDNDKRQEAWRKLHEDDGLDDVNAFLAPKRRPPARIQGAAPALVSSTSAAAVSSGPWLTDMAPKRRPPMRTDIAAPSLAGEAAVSSAVAGRAADVQEPLSETRLLEVRMSARPSVLQDDDFSESSWLHNAPVSPATASSTRARPKAAAFKAQPGPTVEDVRQLQLLHERDGNSTVSDAVQAAIEELHDEELRRAKRDEKRRREEWRKAHKVEKRKKAQHAAAPVRTAEADEDSEGDGDSSDGSSSGARRRKEIQEEQRSLMAKMDSDQKKFWAQKVKGCVSNDNKGFTDADLERRLRQQEAHWAGKHLMSESQVLAMLKTGTKEKVKDKVKKKEKTKERDSRSRERRR